nr:transposase [Kosakonia sp. S42]
MVWPGSSSAQFGRKKRLSSVTKNGNRSLRTLIIHGARSVMRCAKKRDDNHGAMVAKT